MLVAAARLCGPVTPVASAIAIVSSLIAGSAYPDPPMESSGISVMTAEILGRLPVTSIMCIKSLREIIIVVILYNKSIHFVN